MRQYDLDNVLITQHTLRHHEWVQSLPLDSYNVLLWIAHTTLFSRIRHIVVGGVRLRELCLRGNMIEQLLLCELVPVH